MTNFEGSLIPYYYDDSRILIFSIDLPNTTGITVVVIYYTREEEN